MSNLQRGKIYRLDEETHGWLAELAATYGSVNRGLVILRASVPFGEVRQVGVVVEKHPVPCCTYNWSTAHLCDNDDVLCVACPICQQDMPEQLSQVAHVTLPPASPSNLGPIKVTGPAVIEVDDDDTL